MGARRMVKCILRSIGCAIWHGERRLQPPCNDSKRLGQRERYVPRCKFHWGALQASHGQKWLFGAPDQGVFKVAVLNPVDSSNSHKSWQAAYRNINVRVLCALTNSTLLNAGYQRSGTNHCLQPGITANIHITDAKGTKMLICHSIQHDRAWESAHLCHMEWYLTGITPGASSWNFCSILRRWPPLDILMRRWNTAA